MMRLTKILNEIKADFNEFKGMDRNQIFTWCVDHKLDESLKRYDENLNKDIEFLSSKPAYRVLKTLIKIEKERDKESIKQNFKKEGL